MVVFDAGHATNVTNVISFNCFVVICSMKLSKFTRFLPDIAKTKNAVELTKHDNEYGVKEHERS